MKPEFYQRIFDKEGISKVCEKREFLTKLAEDFERKQWMPNVNGARSFSIYELGYSHADASKISSRMDICGKIFRKLANLTLQELKDIQFSGNYGPPKRLATYARAIEEFGDRLRAERMKVK